MRKIVISGINIDSGGALTIFKECLEYCNRNLSDNYEIIALVHKKDIFISETENNIKFTIMFPSKTTATASISKDKIINTINKLNQKYFYKKQKYFQNYITDTVVSTISNNLKDKLNNMLDKVKNDKNSPFTKEQRTEFMEYIKEQIKSLDNNQTLFNENYFDK